MVLGSPIITRVLCQCPTGEKGQGFSEAAIRKLPGFTDVVQYLMMLITLGFISYNHVNIDQGRIRILLGFAIIWNGKYW